MTTNTDSAKPELAGKTLYGLLFSAILPLGLIYWALSSESNVLLPSLGNRVIGGTVFSLGIALLASGMAALWIHARGLPMNAYPPNRFVSQGVYRYLSHSIYVGFCAICFGAALYYSSASGLWLVSPLVTLGCIALVQGFEKEDMSKRFGETIIPPLVRLPDASDNSASGWNRLSVYLLALLPWALVYESFVYFGPAYDSIETYFSFETKIPIIEWTEALYFSVYPAVLIAPLLARTQRNLREFAVSGILSTLIVGICFALFPLIATPRPFEPTTLLGELIVWERLFDSSAAAFPSFHVLWTCITSVLLIRIAPRLMALWVAWAALVAVSCITTGVHSIVDVMTAFILFGIIRSRVATWRLVLRATERVANSWAEWRFGRVRVINHGFYAGAAGVIGFMILNALTEDISELAMLVVFLTTLVCANTVAHLIEGSSRLLRPYSYYGALLGCLIGITLISIWSGEFVWEILGAATLAMPIMQAVGRLRCLVQGCCHGRRAPSEESGIRYNHPNSRVTLLAGLSGELLYPTPLYSILFNLVLSAILFRFWMLSAPLSMIAGLYFILSGLERFVEESYRGEPQTPTNFGLHSYHWFAIISVITGIVLTCFDSPLSTGTIQTSFGGIVVSLIIGAVVTFATGVDFPNSNKRFARLTS